MGTQKCVSPACQCSNTFAGELLDQIENHVVNSERYVAQGVVQLGKARDYQKSRRKKIMIAICLVIIILCVLITPLVLNGTIGGN